MEDQTWPQWALENSRATEGAAGGGRGLDRLLAWPTVVLGAVGHLPGEEWPCSLTLGPSTSLHLAPTTKLTLGPAPATITSLPPSHGSL